MKRKLLAIAALLSSSLFTNAQSWSVQSSGFTHNGTYPFDISIVDSNIAWAAGRDGAGTAISIQEYTRTINGGGLWTAGTVLTDTNYQFSNIMATSANVAYATVFNNTLGENGGIYKTVNGGSAWYQLGVGTIYNSTSFPDFTYFWDDMHGVTVGDPNPSEYEIYTTADSGHTWTAVPGGNIPNPTTGEFAIINDFGVYGDHMWFGTNKGRVYHSIDRGVNWTVANCGPAANTIATISFVNLLEGLAVSSPTTGASTLYRSIDGGATWATVSVSGLLYFGEITNIPGTHSFVSSSASGTVGGVTRGSSYSIDGGTSWVVIDSFATGTGDGYTEMEFLNFNVGYAGGFTVDPITEGISKWVPGGPLSVKPVAETMQDLSAYPNPSSGLITVKMKVLNKEDINIRVTDLLGNVVYSNNIKNSSVLFTKTIDLRNLAKGIYLVNIENGSNRSTEKIVIQ